MKHTLLTLSLLVIAFAMAGCSSSAPSGPAVAPNDAGAPADVNEPPRPAHDALVDGEHPLDEDVPEFEDSPLNSFQQGNYLELRELVASSQGPIYASISFNTYVTTSTILRLAERYGLEAMRLNVKVHDLGGPMVVEPELSLASELQRIQGVFERDLIGPIAFSRDYARFMSEQLREGLYVGHGVFRATPAALTSLWQSEPAIRVVEPHASLETSTGGIAPERHSSESHIVNARKYIEDCQRAPFDGLAWPSLPAHCN